MVNTIEEIRLDVNRVFNDLKSISKEIDDSLDLISRREYTFW